MRTRARSADKPSILAALSLLMGFGMAFGPASAAATTPAPAKTTPAPKATPPPAKPVPPPPAQIDDLSAPIVKSVTDAMGGQATWDKLPYFRFDFVVVRDGKEVARFRHWWDKAHGRCRVEGPDDQGRVVTAIIDLATRKGKSFTDGIADTEPANIQNIIEMGYERWVNDTYWIIMPFKLHDPGTRIRYDRKGTGEGGQTYDVLELSFQKGVGLTPDDRYWLFVNRQTHLIDRWEYVLTGQKPPPQSASWESWSEIGPLRLSLARRFQGKSVMLRFENAATPDAMDESVFTHSRPKE